MKIVKTTIGRCLEYIETLCYCMKLSWNASKYYMILRIISEISTPVLGILSAFIGKYLINLFAGTLVVEDKYKLCMILFICIFIVSILQRVGNSIKQYIQSMHDSILNEKLAVMLMDCSVKADLEYFDNTIYYDKLHAAARDSYSIIQIVWNALTFLSSIITFIGILFVLWLSNPIYGIILTITAIPYAAMSTKYTKSFYDLSIEQLNTERKKSYFQGITLDRQYAQDIRLYNIGSFIIEKYHFLWEEVFIEQKKIARGRTILTVLMGCLPEIVSIAIGINIGFEIFKGASTVGDYSMYTGLIVQFIYACSMLAHSFSNIYDNKLRIINLKSIFEFENHILDNGILEL